MAKLTSFRLDDVHGALLEKMVEKLLVNGIKTNKTDVLQKALYFYARESVLDRDEMDVIIDKHYKGFY
jgi:hypothetical protein